MIIQKASGFENVRLLESSYPTVHHVLASLPQRSLLSEYLSDFLPGGQSQHLRATLRQLPGSNWQLSIRVPSADETGEHFFDRYGAPVR